MSESTMRWFGRRFDTPAHLDMSETPTPSGDACLYCAEAIAEGDAGITLPYVGELGLATRPVHIECWIRSIVGGLRHLEGRCFCYTGNPGDDETNLPYREESKQVIARWWGEDWYDRMHLR